MDGYRVSARIDGGALRRVRPLDVRPDPPAVEPVLTPVELVGRPLEVVIGERWTALRERWSQTTFFLFDADSWRT
jgi:hypothetical protein